MVFLMLVYLWICTFVYIGVDRGLSAGVLLVGSSLGRSYNYGFLQQVP